MKNFKVHLLFIILGIFCGYMLGYLIDKLPLIGIPIFIILLLSFIYLKKDKYTYWLMTVQKPSKTGGKITVTSARKIKDNFFNNKDIDEYYNRLFSETGEWNILFYSQLSKKEFNIYSSNNKNE